MTAALEIGRMESRLDYVTPRENDQGPAADQARSGARVGRQGPQQNDPQGIQSLEGKTGKLTNGQLYHLP